MLTTGLLSSNFSIFGGDAKHRVSTSDAVLTHRNYRIEQFAQSSEAGVFGSKFCASAIAGARCMSTKKARYK